MEKRALILASDDNYLDYTKQLFYAAKKYGNRTGDFVLITCNVSPERPEEIKSEGISKTS